MTKKINNKSLRRNKTHSVVINLLTVFLIIICFESCEGYRCADGSIISKTTGLSLDSVYVEVTTSSKTLYTDSTGKFDVCNGMGGCVPDCKDITIKFSKTNYKTVTLTNPEKDVTVIMEQQ